MRHLMLLTLLLNTPMILADDKTQGSEPVAIIDATTTDAANAPTLPKRWYVFGGKRASDLAALVNNVADQLVTATDNKDALGILKARLTTEDQYSDPRVDLAPGQTIDILVLSRTDQLIPSIQISEEQRSSRIAADFGTLIKVATAIGTKAPPETPKFRVTEKHAGSNGTFKRSTIAVTVQARALKTAAQEKKPPSGGTSGTKPQQSSSPSSDGQVATPQQALTGQTNATALAAVGQAPPPESASTAFDPDSMKADTTVKVSLINGPSEHWFLSADVPITKASQATFDQAGHQVGTKDTPSNPHAALNLLAGDILASNQQQWWDGFMLKGMMQLSKRPRDSYGGGIGYRFPSTWHVLGQELDNFAVFAAYLKETQHTSAGKKQDHHIRGGISLNLDKALDWFKKK